MVCRDCLFGWTIDFKNCSMSSSRFLFTLSDVWSELVLHFCTQKHYLAPIAFGFKLIMISVFVFDIM